jgi:hypothetical protein
MSRLACWVAIAARARHLVGWALLSQLLKGFSGIRVVLTNHEVDAGIDGLNCVFA